MNVPLLDPVGLGRHARSLVLLWQPRDGPWQGGIIFLDQLRYELGAGPLIFYQQHVGAPTRGLGVNLALKLGEGNPAAPDVEQIVVAALDLR